MKRPTFIGAILLFVVSFLLEPSNSQSSEINWDWWRTAVIYQIYPKSFKDADNDGYGDLRGIISKLPHLADAGVNAAWISPIYSSPQVDDGYDISNFVDVWETFGTLEDFDELVNISHQLDIKIIMDLVPNHSSDQHDWFKLSMNETEGYEDYYVWKDGNSTTPPNNWISVFKYSAWTYNENRSQWYLHQFTEQQPDLNYRNPTVLEEMTNVIKFWLDRGVDGFRVDAIPHLYEDEEFRDEPLSGYEGVESYEYDYLIHNYTKDLNETYQVIYYWREILDNYTLENGGDARIMMVESSSELSKTMLYYTDGSRDGAHFPFNFQLLSLSESSSAVDIVNIVNYWLNSMPEGDYVPNWETGNHDQNRAATRFGKNNVDAYNMLNLLLPGVAVTYNGEEIGMENGEVTWEQGQDPSACNGDEESFNSTTRDFARTPYHWDNTTNAGFNLGAETWLPVSSKYIECNLELETNTDANSHYNVYKKLTALRKQTSFTTGSFEIAAVADYVMAFTRIVNETDGIVVVLNTGSTVTTVNLTGHLSNLTDQLEVLVSSITSERIEGDTVITSSIGLSGYESLVLKLMAELEDETAGGNVPLPIMLNIVVALIFIFNILM